MDEPKIELPAWLPWATTACLAALVACLVELWVIERTRTQLLRDQNLLSEAALKGAENQLEAERIINRREVDDLRAAPGPGAALLAAPEGAPEAEPGNGPAWGVVIWSPTRKHALLRFAGLPAQAAGRDYQLWMDGPGPGPPASCGLFHADQANDKAGFALELESPAAPGCRFILIDGPKGGAPTLGEAKSGGSIVLATPSPAEKIPSR
jgi:Anti-sigma-K factor rskA